MARDRITWNKALEVVIPCHTPVRVAVLNDEVKRCPHGHSPFTLVGVTSLNDDEIQ